jgi:hypothetical protein
LSKEDLGQLLPGKLGPQKRIYAEIERIRAIDAAHAAQSLNSAKTTSTSSIHETNKAKDATVERSSVTAKVAPSPRESPTEMTKPSKSTDVEKGDTIKGKKDNHPKDEKDGKGPAPSPSTAPAVTEKDKGLLDKYGLTLPTTGSFLTTVAIGTVQKHIIDKYTYPFMFPGTEDKKLTAATDAPAAGGPSDPTQTTGQELPVSRLTGIPFITIICVVN